MAFCSLSAGQPSGQWLDIIAVGDPGGENQTRHLHRKVGQQVLVQAASLAQVLDKEIDAELHQVNLEAHC